MGSISHHIMPLVINSLGDKHTHMHTQTHRLSHTHTDTHRHAGTDIHRATDLLDKSHFK